jgi:hypothetical protein
VDFACAERRAAVEAKRIRQLRYGREHKEASAQVAREAAALELKNKSTATAASTGASSAAADKLGAGAKKLGLRAFPHAQPAAAPKARALPLRPLAGVA